MDAPKLDQVVAATEDLQAAFADAEDARKALAEARSDYDLAVHKDVAARTVLMDARRKLDAMIGLHVEVALIEERTLCEAEPRYTRGMTTVTPVCDGLACERPGCPTHDQQYGEVEVQ